MSRSCSNDKAIKGGEWTEVLYYTPNATKPGDSAIKVPDENLKSYFANVDGTGDAIVKVKIYKNNLCGGWVPKVAGLWHEFTVVESTNWYWSFEKNDYGICVQRGKDETSKIIIEEVNVPEMLNLKVETLKVAAKVIQCMMYLFGSIERTISTRAIILPTVIVITLHRCCLKPLPVRKVENLNSY